MLKVAFVVQRYGTEINGGAELHCRHVAEHMSKYWDIEVLTTCAKDYYSWKNEFKEGIETVNNISVRKFSVDKQRRMFFFKLYSILAFREKSSFQQQERWMKLQGPFSSSLFQFIEDHKNNYQYFFFFTYLYCTTYFGLKYVRDKAILIPTAHDERPIYLNIFKKMFLIPQGFIFNTIEEKSFVDKLFSTENKASDVVGVGVKLPGKVENIFRKKFNVSEKYVLYIGRIDVMKGCKEMFEYFIRFIKDFKVNVKLILSGHKTTQIPFHPDIIYLGSLSEADKFEALHSAEFTIMPSKYESLSIFCLESWLLKKAVLVNQKSKVLKGQCSRSGGGILYNDYQTFSKNINLLLSDKTLNNKLGENGYNYVTANYRWDIIEKKYLAFIDRLQTDF